MRPQSYINFMPTGGPVAEDLGWNDMGHDDVPEVVALPGHDVPSADNVAVPQVVQQQQELAAHVSPTEPTTGYSGLTRAAPGSRGKAAFTLRLDPDRHLRLRLLSAVTHKSAQQIVTAALDAALELQNVAIDEAKSVNGKG